jgi:ubiquinone biosynthesis protein UbiJ
MSAAPPLLCAGIEVALNRYLALEAGVLAQCAELSGRCIGLRVAGMNWDFFVEFHGGGVRVMPSRETAADVTVTGTLPKLLRLGWDASHGASGLPRELEIDGDTELLTRFNKMLAQVGFDPEEFAAKFVGDTAAHRVTQGLQKLFGFGRDTVRTLGLDTAEYLREETRDLARGADVGEWMIGVDTLRDDVERLAARIERLEAARA